VGRVIGLWGVQGWLRIYSDTQPPDAVFSYSPWLIGPDRQPFEVDDWRRQGPRLMAHFSGLDDPDTAAALVDQVIEVERRALPTLDAGRFYWSDLIGLDVVNLQGYGYGAVSRLLETGANDVLDVRSEQGESVLIPFVLEEFIKDVDLTSRRIVVDWPVEWTQ
jgi:16S rRNA processing protein RimM